MNKNGKFLFLILTLLLLFISVGTISATDVDNTTVSDDMTLNTPSDVVLEKVITKASKQQNTEVAIVNKNKTQKQIKTDKQTKKTVETIQTANNYETLKTAWNNIQTDGDDTTEYTINVKNGNYTFTEELKSDNTSKNKIYNSER